MRRLGAISILGIWAFFGAGRLCAQELAAVQPDTIDPASFMRVYGSTEPPHAFVRPGLFLSSPGHGPNQRNGPHVW